MANVERRYAQALLDLLVEVPDQIDRVGGQLAELAQLYRESSEMRDLSVNPRFPAQDKKQVLSKWAQSAGAHMHLRNFLCVLVDRNRLELLPNIERSFADLARTHQGCLKAEVVSAVSLSEAYKAELTRVLETITEKRVMLDCREDASIMGGVVAKVGGRVFDGSVQTQLASLGGELVESN